MAWPNFFVVWSSPRAVFFYFLFCLPSQPGLQHRFSFRPILCRCRLSHGRVQNTTLEYCRRLRPCCFACNKQTTLARGAWVPGSHWLLPPSCLAISRECERNTRRRNSTDAAPKANGCRYRTCRTADFAESRRHRKREYHSGKYHVGSLPGQPTPFPPLSTLQRIVHCSPLESPPYDIRPSVEEPTDSRLAKRRCRRQKRLLWPLEPLTSPPVLHPSRGGYPFLYFVTFSAIANYFVFTFICLCVFRRPWEYPYSPILYWYPRTTALSERIFDDRYYKYTTK